MRRVAALLLAAGGSARLGAPKQLARSGGTSLVRRAAETARRSRCDAVFATLGARRERVAAELAGLGVAPVEVPDWREGLAASLRRGVAAVDEAGFDALVVLLADQPRIGAAHVDALVDAFERRDRGLVASAYAGTLGVPALFARSHFAALRTLEGDRGARDYLRARAQDVEAIPLPEGAFDVDEPADLEDL